MDANVQTVAPPELSDISEQRTRDDTVCRRDDGARCFCRNRRTCAWCQHEPVVYVAQAVPRWIVGEFFYERRRQRELCSTVTVTMADVAVDRQPSQVTVNTACEGDRPTAVAPGVIELMLPKAQVRITGDVDVLYLAF